MLFFGQATALDLTDNNICTEIRILIEKELDIPSHQISVSTDDRIVILYGKVETRLQADKIIELANSVDYVKRVNPTKLKVVSSKKYIKDAFITAAAKGKILRLTNFWLIRKQ